VNVSLVARYGRVSDITNGSLIPSSKTSAAIHFLLGNVQKKKMLSVYYIILFNSHSNLSRQVLIIISSGQRN
jgi:hypothetical protein